MSVPAAASSLQSPRVWSEQEKTTFQLASDKARKIQMQVNALFSAIICKPEFQKQPLALPPGVTECFNPIDSELADSFSGQPLSGLLINPQHEDHFSIIEKTVWLTAAQLACEVTASCLENTGALVRFQELSKTAVALHNEWTKTKNNGERFAFALRFMTNPLNFVHARPTMKLRVLHVLAQNSAQPRYKEALLDVCREILTSENQEKKP